MLMSPCYQCKVSSPRAIGAVRHAARHNARMPDQLITAGGAMKHFNELKRKQQQIVYLICRLYEQ